MRPVYFEGDSGTDGSENLPHTFISSEISSKVYEHYLDYALDNPHTVRQLCTLLRGIEEHDTVILRINSVGGRFDYAAQIMNAIRECNGGVVGVIEQECASAATMIFLACNQWQVQPYGEMMIHNASFGASGKAHEVSARVRSSENMFEALLPEIYEGFLSEQEIQDVIKGQDIYLTQQQIVSRLENVAEIRNQEEDNDEPSENPEDDDSEFDA